MGATITVDQIARVLEALAPEHSERIRSVFGVDITPSGNTQRKGFVFISENDKRWYPKPLLALAREACPAWSKPNFSPRRWIEAAQSACLRLREANPETALAFLLRKGIQTLANDWYLAVPRDWQDYALVGSSDAFAEWHGPLYGSTIAARVARGGRFPEGRVLGEDSVLVNYKFGLIESFDRELFDDDQTGQIRNRAARLGQSMAITESAYSALRFIGAAASYANLVVPVSNYTTTDVNGSVVTGPWSSTIYGSNPGGGSTYGNRPSTYVALGLNPLKQAWSNMLNAKDPQQNKIIVNPNVLLVSPQDALHAPLLVAPPAGVPYYPAIPGATGQTAFGGATTNIPTSGFPGGVFGANPFMGLGIKPVVVRFFPDWAWAIGEKAKGFIFQERDPLEVIQEQVASGAAFEVDAYRFRSRRRFESDWVGGGSRFWWLGDDGSVAGSF